MTSRERVLAAATGGIADRKPMMIWPHDEMYSDVAIVSTGRLANAGRSTRIVLAEVLSPFARSLKSGSKLTRLLEVNPSEGEEALNALADETRAEIDAALSGHADGIFYRLQGAEPGHSTPMEYGGHFLEVDRELMEHASSAKLNVLYVEGGPEIYIDFVSDLPAQVFAWDCVRSEIELQQVRAVRPGALATSDPEADVLFGGSYRLLQQLAHSSALGAEGVEAHA